MANKKKNTEAPTSLSLSYSLAELPSSQHRAGLAGLVLLTRWLERQPERKGIFRLSALNAAGLTLELDALGLKEAFDELYAASSEEIAYPQPLKKKDKTLVPAIRQEQRQETDDKGKVKTKTVYIYPTVIPRGGLLDEWDRSEKKLWLKLWRNFIWQIPRGNPQSRAPFEERAEGAPSKDHGDTWKSLCELPEPAVKLPSTYYLGAQEKTAEDVLFRDRARSQLLLHFWPLTVGLYVPQVVNAKDGKREFVGFAVTVPDVSDLKQFCLDYPLTWGDRPQGADGYRPRGAVVDLAIEGALDMGRLLRQRLASKEGKRDTQDLVFGFDVFHLSKEGKNVRLLSAGRFEPDGRVLEDYERFRDVFVDPFFRKQWLLNLVARSPERPVPWFRGFDRLLMTLPHGEQGFGSWRFRKDARAAFAMEKSKMEQNAGSGLGDDSRQTMIIYRMVQTYVLTRVEQKCGLRWDKVKDKEEKSPERRLYEETKEKVARDAFLAIRSRSGRDFLDYFAGTVASTQQRLNGDDFVLFTRWLREHTEDARTLTLLALSAVG